MTATPEMIPSDLTLEIGDDLSPDRFVAAVRAFFGYVKDVSDGLSPEARYISWRVQVREGSALIGITPETSVAPEIVQSVYSKVASGIELVRGGDITGAGLSEGALKHLKTLSEISDADKQRPVQMRVWVRRKPVPMSRDIGETIAEDWRSDYSDFGTIEGRLVGIQDRGTLQIHVRDILFNQTVRCYFAESMLPTVFENFRKRVEISGTIHYRRNGTPISIEAVHIETLPEDSELPTAKDVRGILGTRQ